MNKPRRGRSHPANDRWFHRADATTSAYIQLFREIVFDVWKDRQREAIKIATAFSLRVQQHQQKKQRVIETLLHRREIDRETYQDQLDRTREEIAVAELELHRLYARVLWELIRRLSRHSSAMDQSGPEMFGAWIDRGIVLGALEGLAGFITSGSVHYNWGDSTVMMIFYFLMGLSLVIYRESEARRP